MSHRPRIAGTLLVTLFSVICTNVKGQHVSGGHRKNDSLPTPRYTPPSDSVIQARLVELALQGPQYDATDHRVKIAESQLSKAKKSWLNLLAVSANYNDQTFAKTTPGAGGYVYPKYFFGLTIPLGVIFAMGPDIKAGREGVAVSKDARDELARTIRADVLSDYRQYKNYGDLILLQNTIVVDQQAAFSQVEKKFKEGTISIEQYNLANENYSNEVAKKLNLQMSQDLVRIAIEKLIGTDLENVIK